MRRRTLGLVVIFANAAIAAVLAFARSAKSARAATLERKPRREDDDGDAPAPSVPAPSSSSSPKRWTVPGGFRALRASEITPELRNVATEIAKTLKVEPGAWLPFELGGKMYGAVRTKAAWRYYIRKTPEEAAEDLPPAVPLPDSLTH